MQQNQLFILKLFATILLCTLFFTAFSRLGAFAYERVFMPEESYDEGTYIGPVEVGGMQPWDAVQKINDRIMTWQAADTISLSFADKTVQLPNQLFHFEAEASLASAVSGMPNPLYASIKEHKLKERLSIMIDESVISSVNLKQLRIAAEELAGTLPSSEKVLKVSEYMKDESLRRNVILSENELTLSAWQPQLSAWIQTHGEMVIPAKTNFSMLQWMEDQDGAVYSNEFLSKMASGIYEAILSTNLEIVERNTSKVLPEGYHVGKEAKIMKEKMDFILYNPNDHDLKITFKMQDSSEVSIMVTGMDTGYSYKVRFENEKTYEPKQIIQYTPDLNTVRKDQLKRGKNGYSVSVYRDIYYNGELLDRILIAEDFYLPENEVIIREIRTAEPEEASTMPEKIPAEETDKAEEVN